MKENVFKKVILYSLILFAGLIGSIIISLKLGAVNISWKEIFFIFKNCFRQPQTDSTFATILLEIRLPRILLAAVVGASLSIAGVAFQGILRNPLADPYIIGTSAGAAFGAAVAILLGLSGSFLGISLTPIIAFVTAVLTMLIVWQLAKKGNKLPVVTFLLAGVMVGAFMWALVSFLLIIAKEDMPKIIFWLMGSLSYQSWSHLLIVLPYFLISSFFLYIYSYSLNLFTLGEEQAQHLGVETEKIKFYTILAASLVTAGAVSAAGIIGFVGLMIPHIMRMLTGPDHRVLYPVSAVAGAIFLIWADNLARIIVQPAEIPVGIITAILGVPFFLYLLRKSKSIIW